MLQAIQQLASDIAKRINENKSYDGYTFICSHLELRRIVNEVIPDDENEDDTHAMHLFFDEMQYEHNMFLTVSEYDEVVLDEREEEF